jgi:hypothetical protein
VLLNQKYQLSKAKQTLHATLRRDAIFLLAVLVLDEAELAVPVRLGILRVLTVLGDTHELANPGLQGGTLKPFLW